MRNYGSTAGTRAYEQQLVARAYPSPVQYRRVLTPYEQQKAEAGQLFYGNANANANATSDDLYRLVGLGLTFFIGVEVLQRLFGDRSFGFYK